MPFIAAMLAFIWLGEAITLYELVAMCCCFGGIAIVAVGNESASEDGPGPITQEQDSASSAY